MIKYIIKKIILEDIFKALFVGIKNFFVHPVTRKLQDIHRSDNFRDIVLVDKYKCIRCALCEGICPNNAIKIEQGVPIFNEEKCCYCRLCKKICPRQAIKINKK